MVTKFQCPVCGYPGLEERPRSAGGDPSYEICPSCGFEFGVSDDSDGLSYQDWRIQWIAHGMIWSGSAPAPTFWDPKTQVETLTPKPN